VLSVPRDEDDRVVISGWATAGVLVTVLVLIGIVLFAQTIPHAKRPTIRPAPITTVITETHTVQH
jgi:hypothetical protein